MADKVGSCDKRPHDGTHSHKPGTSQVHGILLEDRVKGGACYGRSRGTAEGSVGRGPWTMPNPEDTGTIGRTQDTWELFTHSPGSLGCPKAQALELLLSDSKCYFVNVLSGTRNQKSAHILRVQPGEVSQTAPTPL